jgi:Ulp1 family protease
MLHRILTEVQIRNRVILCYDSFNDQETINFCTRIWNLMYSVERSRHKHVITRPGNSQKIFEKQQDWTFLLVTSPSQLNGYDCGKKVHHFDLLFCIIPFITI